MKVAYFSPFPPERTGISEYSELLLPALRRRLDVEVVARGGSAPRGADVCLYHVGNNPDAHGWIVEALRRRPGVVVLHDFVLHHLVAGLTLGRRDGQGYLGAMQREAGVPGRLLAHGVLDGVVPPLWEVRPEDFPLAGEVLEHAAKPGGGLIVHSRYVAQRALAAGYDGRLWRIPHPAWPVPEELVAQSHKVVRPGEPLVGCFGNLNASKRIPQLLEAFARLRKTWPEACLLLVGAEAPGFDLAGRLAGLGLEGVEREDYVDEDRLWTLMAACDVCVALRSPTMGETSGTAIRALVLGRPLVVSDTGWFRELPDDVALKVPVDAHEAETLAGALELLAANPAAREEMGRAARDYAAREHDLERVAEAYVAALEEAVGGDAVRDVVAGEVANAAAAVGIDDPTELAARLNEVRLGG
jgi:glycosyltransferase involved in cell wall biosynthesis